MLREPPFAGPGTLAPEQLYRACDPSDVMARTPSDERLPSAIAQSRAAGAIALAMDMQHEGYNLFVMGPAGSGKRTLVSDCLAQRARTSGAEAPDWVYVNNFAEPHKPLAMRLPPGAGVKLREDLRELLEELRNAIPALFESDEYRARAAQLESEFTERHEKAFTALGEEAAAQGVGLLRTPAGFSFAPIRAGEVIAPEDYERLPDEEKERLRTVIEALQKKLEELVRTMMAWRRELRTRVKQLNRDMTLLAVEHLVEELKQRYADLPQVTAHLERLEADVLDNVDDFRAVAPSPQGGPVRPDVAAFQRYGVNVMVDHSGPNGVPLVTEDHPTCPNLVGRIDHVSQFGTLLTDFTLIKPGALHRANGGYLLLDARKLLTQPFAWDALKRTLSSGQIRIEGLAEMYSLVSTTSLEPEPIPLAVKVVLFGDRELYYLLAAYDPDFDKLFKIVADLDDACERTPDSVSTLAQTFARMAERHNLLPLAPSARARLVEHGARRAGDARKLDANLRAMSDLLCEADRYARDDGAAELDAAHIDRAITAQRTRADRLHRRLHEAMLRGTLMIDTSGERIGQVNGLSVFELGGHAFGEPTRITATTRLGDGRVIDVQREVELGGPIHSKGVLILSAFLAARYSHNHPHALAASLVFEQTYGVVDGDSASLAELCALLSSLADAPVRQGLAVTGSVNQLGEVQAIGAVNEKIEGFFELCRARGLAAGQGVIIPWTNVEHLMLDRTVVDAVRAGSFAVHAVRDVDEAMALLTGTTAGRPDAAGGYAPDSVNGRVARRLHALSQMLRLRGRSRRADDHHDADR